MEVVILFAFVGLVLVAFALLLLGNSLRHRDYQHADRLALLPMQEDSPPRSAMNSELHAPSSQEH